MKKNVKLFAIILFAVQLLFVISMLFYGLAIDSLFEKYGKTYKVKIDSINFVDYRYCNFELYQDYIGYYDLIHRSTAYLYPEENGLYSVGYDGEELKNAETFLSCSFPDRFPYADKYELKTEYIDNLFNTDENGSVNYTYYTSGYFYGKETYVEIKAFFGTCEIVEVYCDGITIEEYINLIKQGKIKNPYSDIY